MILSLIAFVPFNGVGTRDGGSKIDRLKGTAV